jgi:hypothetical protein
LSFVAETLGRDRRGGVDLRNEMVRSWDRPCAGIADRPSILDVGTALDRVGVAVAVAVLERRGKLPIVEPVHAVDRDVEIDGTRNLGLAGPADRQVLESTVEARRLEVAVHAVESMSARVARRGHLLPDDGELAGPRLLIRGHVPRSRGADPVRHRDQHPERRPVVPGEVARHQVVTAHVPRLHAAGHEIGERLDVLGEGRVPAGRLLIARRTRDDDGLVVHLLEPGEDDAALGVVGLCHGKAADVHGCEARDIRGGPEQVVARDRQARREAVRERGAEYVDGVPVERDHTVVAEAVGEVAAAERHLLEVTRGYHLLRGARVHLDQAQSVLAEVGGDAHELVLVHSGQGARIDEGAVSCHRDVRVDA